jgi:hypothetical protein
MIIYNLIFDVNIVIGIGNSRANSTSKIMKITAIKRIVMKMVVVLNILGQTHIQTVIFFLGLR